MKSVKQIKLVQQDIVAIVGIVDQMLIRQMLATSAKAYEYKDDVSEARLIHFLQNDLDTVKLKAPVKRFYEGLNSKLQYINSKFKLVKLDYVKILKEKKLLDLRTLFAKVNLTSKELKAVPLLMECLDIECNKNILFMIENEIYVRQRVTNETKNGVKYENPNKYLSEIKLVEENNKLKEKLEKLEEEIEVKDGSIIKLEKTNEQLKLELDFDYKEIGYFYELSQEDFGQIVKDLGKHNSEIKDKFKDLITVFEESGEQTEDKLYELWMQWTEEEITVMDSVLKKSMYQEKICKSDVSDLEVMSDNLKNRHLLSRLVLHLIYRRMSSQCWEEVLG